jgi:predicted ATPase
MLAQVGGDAMALAVREFRARGYRSLQAIAYPMSGLDVFVGANGVGKTNLYRALELLQSAANNTLALELAREGLMSALWAGERRRNEQPELRLEVGLADPDHHGSGSAYKYEVTVGFPTPTSGAFTFEPQIKDETVSHVGGKRPYPLVERRNYAVKARDDEGRWETIDIDLLASETILGRLEDPSRYPELDAIRRTLLQWRFYHSLRTDPDSPLRRPCPAVATPTLASDGSNLAAVFATLSGIVGDTTDLRQAIDAAFPGARLRTDVGDGRWARLGMTFPEFPKREFAAEELSDGTLRFLALAGALLAYRLPPFVALNEPEASLHPDLMKPLAGLIARAATRTQIWLVTHSTVLAEAVVASGAGKVRTVLKEEGATQIAGLKRWGEFEEEED